CIAFDSIDLPNKLIPIIYAMGRLTDCHDFYLWLKRHNLSCIIRFCYCNNDCSKPPNIGRLTKDSSPIGAKNKIPNRNLSKNTISIITIITSAIYTKEFKTIMLQLIISKMSYMS